MMPARTKNTQPKRRKGVVAAAIAAGAAALLTGIFVATTAGGGLVSSPQATSIPALAPADSDTFILAPYSASWWTKVASMAPPETAIASLDPSASGIEIDHVGYSRSADHEERGIPVTGPYRLFFVEASSAADAEQLADWFRNAEGFEGRRVFVEGNTVVITRSWVTEYKAPEQSMAGVAGFTGTTSATEGSMYRNPDREVESLAGGPATKNGKALSTVMRNGFGFTESTTWVGTSKDGSVWEGDFLSGGVDPGQISFGKAQAALDSTSEKIAEVQGENVKYSGYSGGVGDILSTSTFRTPDNGVLGRAAMAPSSATSVKDEAVSVVSDVTGWDAAASGKYSSRENVATQTVSASPKSMVVSFEYGSH